jgi:hypothetical protein
LSLSLVLIPELQHTPLPPKCWEPGSLPQLFILPLFSPFGLAIESIKEFGGASRVDTKIGSNHQKPYGRIMFNVPCKLAVVYEKN